LKKPSLNDWSAGNETVDDHDYCDDEQNVNEAAGHREEKETESPKDKENYRDGPKHGRILARSE
jgi:hypothetical protein